ncbi:MAG: potassium channel family protein [Candidatus Limivicinus sp.]|jgi:voltage-gated potassium channel
MKRIQVLKRVLRDTGANRIWAAFVIEFFVSAAIIWLCEPDFHRYGDALWYLYAVVTTIGFGDFVAQHLVSRILSVLMSISAAVVIAIITGVIVNYFNHISSIRNEETLAAFMDKLEHLPELPPEELEQLSLKVRDFRNKG